MKLNLLRKRFPPQYILLKLCEKPVPRPLRRPQKLKLLERKLQHVDGVHLRRKSCSHQAEEVVLHRDVAFPVVAEIVPCQGGRIQMEVVLEADIGTQQGKDIVLLQGVGIHQKKDGEEIVPHQCVGIGVVRKLGIGIRVGVGEVVHLLGKGIQTEVVLIIDVGILQETEDIVPLLDVDQETTEVNQELDQNILVARGQGVGIAQNIVPLLELEQDRIAQVPRDLVQTFLPVYVRGGMIPQVLMAVLWLNENLAHLKTAETKYLNELIRIAKVHQKVQMFLTNLVGIQVILTVIPIRVQMTVIIQKKKMRDLHVKQTENPTLIESRESRDRPRNLEN